MEDIKISELLDFHKKNVKKSSLPKENKQSITACYFIYVYYQVGNIGSRDVRAIDEQPKDGFKTEKEAEQHLTNLILEKKGHYFDRSWYMFTILKTWKSLSAV
jgi:hypothetical protein